MNCINLLESIGRRLLRIIEQKENTVLFPTPEYGWENYRFHSHKFRLAHVEIFNQDRFCVIHCCVFPHVTDPSPIFGFDAIAGESKITGAFLDLSPVTLPSEPFLNIDVAKTRERPEWGEIFSPHWLACRPTFDEMTLIGDEAARVLTVYLSTLGLIGDSNQIINMQNRYCFNQRKNPHTTKALANLLGQERATEFIDTILFPTISAEPCTATDK